MREKYTPEVARKKAAYRKDWWQGVLADFSKYKIYMLRRAKHRAKLLNLPFDLTPDDITIPERCPLLGIVLKPEKTKARWCAPSLDRIIPELGYVKGNVMVVSQRANVLKRDASLEELEMLVCGLRRITRDQG
jgi:hypothetical protein